MSRTDEGKESEINEDKQKNEIRDAFITLHTLNNLASSGTSVLRR